MFFVKANSHQQQLNITIQEIFDAEDLKSIIFTTQREVIKLDTGWTAAIDLRGMRVLEQKLTRYIKQIQQICLTYEAARLVVLVDNMILKMQFQRVGIEAGSDAITSQFMDEKEWQAFLLTPATVKNPKSK